jgi:hypothetical protein
MQAILMLTIIGTLLLLPGSSTAETNAECQTHCAAEKTTRDADCPPPDQDEETDKARAQCLLDSVNIYNTCVSTCPQPEPTDDSQAPSPQ